ncbi:MAG: CHAT domain-containing protein [Polaribacter sp.]|jgi:CHAT domain-containing protein
MKYSVILQIIIFLCFQCSNSQTSELEQAYNNAYNFHYTNKDSAYYYYHKTIDLGDKQNELEYILSAYIYLMNANGHYYDLKDYQKNLKKEDSLLLYDPRFKSLENLNYYKDYLLFDKGNYHYKIKNYTTAKVYFQKLFTKLIAIPEEQRNSNDLSTLSSLYSFLGAIYKHTGKYELAEYNYKKDIALLSTKRDSFYDWTASTINAKKLLSQVYESKKNFKAANLLLIEALSFYKEQLKDPSNKNRILSTYILLAKNYIIQENFALAIATLDESAQLQFEDHPFSKEINIIYGDAYLGLKDYDKAEAYYNTGVLKTTTYRENEKHQDLADVFARLGKLYLKKKEISLALTHYQKALMQLETNFNNPDYSSNPDPEKVLSKTVLITILKEKLNAFIESYTITNDIEYLKKANITSKAFINTLDVLRPEFESKLDKEFLTTETYPTLQKMVQISYELYQQNKELKYIHDAFYYMEKSKSIALLEAHRNSEATKYGNIPQDIISEEQIYRAKISYLDKEIFKSNLNEKEPLIDSLFSTKKKYYDYIDKIEKDYPKYHSLKYKSDVISTSDLKKQLNSNQSVFNYLVTDNSIFLIVLTHEKEAFYELPFNETLNKTITDFYRQLSTPNIVDRTAYSKKSTLIYKAIIEPALQNTKTTDIVILADDVLNYIPFDVLQTDSENESSYLLSKYTISYASSATLLQEQNKTKVKSSNKLMIFAPQFTESISEQNVSQERFDLGPLLYNRQEAQNISAYFKGKIYDGNKASIDNFQKDYKSYNLIHFATHASANDEYPDYSYLAFENTDNNSNLLYVKDLYNYRIDADMVTLSACQTGFGKLQKGEGMLSLARGFNYAGVPSLVNSLWKINDQSTSEIMQSFYENLSDGLNKKEALRQAKLSYLSTNDDAILRHPYYWSGIVITGNTAALNSTNYLLWSILIVVGILLIWLAYKKLFKLFK